MRPYRGRSFLLFEKDGASINLHTKKNIWLFPSVRFQAVGGTFLSEVSYGLRDRSVVRRAVAQQLC